MNLGFEVEEYVLYRVAFYLKIRHKFNLDNKVP
jgi:hypothetical protein